MHNLLSSNRPRSETLSWLSDATTADSLNHSICGICKKTVACKPLHPTVRLNCFWYFAGVIPVRPLKIRVKWLWDENPRSRATLARGTSFLSVPSDRLIRLRFTKRPILKPVDCRNFLAK